MKSTLRHIVVALLATACFSNSPKTEAVTPAPDGGYANNNTAEGTDALFNLSTGANNTALGYSALHNNTNGDYNTAVGSNSMANNISGGANTAHGYNALGENTIGLANTALGKDALALNTTGSVNTASGDVTLASNTIGSANTGSGVNALFQNTSGNNNTASGFAALMNNTTGSNNIALGYQAGLNQTTGDNNIAIGNTGVATEAGKIRIGTRGVQNTTYVAGIFGSTVSSGAPVSIDSKGHLGTVTSSSRFKHDIQPMGHSSNSILALQPVTYRYKEELDPEHVPQFGLVAEEVAKVNPDLVVRDEQGRPYTVRYEAVNAMLLNEFLKEHRKVAILEETVAQLKSAFEKQAAQIKQVSAQLQTERPAARVVSSAP
ncbi:MAG: tail fiber domain-containing protein [Chthoniobacterales bacterium]